jgi:hypothetical protein
VEEPPLTREALMAGYERPYARWLPAAWRIEHVQAKLVLALVALAGLGALDALDDGDFEWLWLGVVLAAGTLVWSLWVTVTASLIIRNRIRDRTESRHELASVRKRRPHAGEADPDLAHAEYAVAVGDDGDLVTWRFRPLAANESQRAADRLLTGKPCYSAAAVDHTAYDPVDAARAAEQLADAQQAAAALEKAAIERTARQLEDRRREREIEVESRSTGAALRGITGQSD